ncbi:MAG: histidine kinase [Lachnospiraceae bacterium]|nr:histidine kinase [Lachnospiraceae bacterium]
MFRSSQQSVRLYLDDVLVYAYENPGSRLTGIATPSRWNMIPLESTDASKELRIELKSPYSQFSGIVNTVYLGSSTVLTSNLLKNTLHGYICSLLILIFGIIMLFTSHIFHIRNHAVQNFRYLGCFNILLSLWMRSEVRLPDYLTFDPHFELMLGICSMMLCPIPYLLFVKNRLNEKLHHVIKILLYLYSANFIICAALQLLGICDMLESSIVFLVLVVPTVVVICFHYILQLLHRERKYPVFFIFSFLSLFISIIVELIYYYLKHIEYYNYVFHTVMTIYIICLTFTAVQSIVSNEMLSAQVSEQILVGQIKMMLSHIQPHFLFNSLGAIQSLIRKSPDTAYQMLFDFSKYLRASINAWNAQATIPFSSEIENVKAFTNIQLIRFHNNFHVDFELDCTNFSVPLLSIRALVENAVNYGARRSTLETPFVRIHSYKTRDYFMVEVIDNGPGFDVDEKLSSSESTSGLHRCKHSLETQLNATLDIHSIPGNGTTVIVRIPR